MALTDINPNAANRDGIRESQLRDLGLNTPVVHGPGGVVTITLTVGQLDHLISDGLGDVDHDECFDDIAMGVANEAGYTRGHKAAIDEIKQLAEQQAKADQS